MSVVVCTRDRSSKLARTLSSLDACTRPAEVDVEIFVVDNGSTDDTRETFERFAATSTQQCRYVLETTPGKSAALNTGVVRSSGDHVVFTDDDAIVSTDWLERLAREYRKEPGIAGIGGRVELYDPNDSPVSVRRSTERKLLTAADFSIENIPIIGCNMSFRKEVMVDVGLFDEKLGPGSRTRAVAEDADMLYRVLRCGHVVLYAPDIVVYHHHGRRADVDLTPLYRSYLRGRGAFYCKWIARADWPTVRSAYYELRRVLRSIVGLGSNSALATSPWRALALLVSGAAAYAVRRRPRRSPDERSAERK